MEKNVWLLWMGEDTFHIGMEMLLEISCGGRDSSRHFSGRLKAVSDGQLAIVVY